VIFPDRHHAGIELAGRLTERGPPLPRPLLVLALPRGGVPVAVPVARALAAPLEVLVARKVGAPGHEEFGIGAVAEGLDGSPVAVRSAEARLFAPGEVADGFTRAAAELARRVERYRGDRPLPGMRGHTVVLVDDGLATGITAEAALRSLLRAGVAKLVLAVPVAAEEAAVRLGELAHEVVTVARDPCLGAVGAWYQDFHQLDDAQVLRLLRDWPVPAVHRIG
jgi:putative phosphoribosyl transferase